MTVVLILLAVLIVGAVLTEWVARSIASCWGEPLWMKDFVIQQKDSQMWTMARSGPADVVFTGSSIMMCGVDPTVVEELSGLRSYNAAVFRGCPTLTEALTVDLIQPRIAPRIAVMEVFALTRNDNSWMGHELGRHNRSKWKNASPAARRRYELGHRFVTVRMLDLARNVKQIKDALRSWKASNKRFMLSRPLHGLATMGVRGECIEYDYPGAKSKPGVGKAIVRHMDNWEVGGPEHAALVRNVEIFQQAGAVVLWCQPPVTRELREELFPGGLAGWHAETDALRKMADELGVEWLEAPVELDDDADFADFIHLNGQGKGAWSRSVGVALKSHPAVQARVGR